MRTGSSPVAGTINLNGYKGYYIMDQNTLVLALIFDLLIGYWATTWNRNGFGWFLVGFIFSPIIAAIALLIAGKYENK
jgi:hypothetical protein